MKFLRSALIVLSLLAGLLRAQDDERRAPPTEIPDFSNLDEYIYEPKSTLTYGFRGLKGAKLKFSGQGKLLSPEDPGSAIGANLLRKYHDGIVSPDARVALRYDATGNAILDPGSGSAVSDPIASDGKTNTWRYDDARQIAEIFGYVAMHSYSADVTDTSTRSKDANNTFGMELAVSRDMGKLFGGRLPWTFTAGFSVNDLSGSTSGGVQARLRTVTDYFSLYGVTPPDAPYAAPSTSTTNVLDASGNPVISESGVAQTVSTDTTVLLGNEPAGRTVSDKTDATSVTNRWKLKGAYYTFRAGPTLVLPVSGRFRASISAGAAVIYSGSNYSVTQSYTPDIGAEITDSSTSFAYKLLPGYYADASLQFDITDTAGFYAGAVYQSAGSYSQNLNTATANYATRIDFSNQSGMRAGMTIRF